MSILLVRAMRAFSASIITLLWLIGLQGIVHADSIPSLKDLNIVLIVVDTLGAKHLSLYDSSLTNSPHIQALANKGILFEQDISAAPWTKPAIASLMTGRYPSHHRVTKLGGVLNDAEVTLAEALSAKGFQTRGIVSHTLISSRYKFDQGFKEYNKVQTNESAHKAVTSALVTDEGIKWLQGLKKDQKFFLFLHYFDPHYNYQHHPEFDQTAWYKGPLKSGTGFRELNRLVPQFTKDDFRFLVGLYREEIAYTDHHIGRLLSALDSLDRTKNTLIILTADHGEAFGEHGILGHTTTLYDELIHVPLVIALPGKIKPAKVSTLVSPIDILPTILSLDEESEFPEALDGHSLLDILEGGDIPARTLISEVHFGEGDTRLSKLAVISSTHKLIRDNSAKRLELYNRKTDKDELNSLPLDKTAEYGSLAKLLEDYHRNDQLKSGERRSEDAVTHTKEEIKDLKSLGYL